MESVSSQPHVLQHLVASSSFESDPFVLIDIGCALGIDPVWRLFGKHLVAHGFDPQVDECARLRSAEPNPNVSYHAAFIGLRADHPIHMRTQVPDRATREYFNPMGRTSASRAAHRNLRIAHDASEAVAATNRWEKQNLAVETISVSEFLARKGVESVDFVKIDTDGSDLEAAMSCASAVRSAGILGFLIESPFSGSGDPADNTFHNIDRYMKEQGFGLFGMTVNTYSRAALPMPFVYAAPYQTRGGQPIWGDMLYLRDAGSPQYEAVWGSALPATKLLKLICLLELFQLPDCAAEVVLANRSAIASAADPDGLLDLLTPPLRGRRVSYVEYNAAFDNTIELFYPEGEPPVSIARPPSTRRRFFARPLLRRLATWQRRPG
jgi:FkbM family methyltransferase